MAKETESGQEKSEEPTGKRLSDARRDGKVAQSNELNQIMGMTAAFVAIYFISPYLWRDLVVIIRKAFGESHHMLKDPATSHAFQDGFTSLLWALAPEIFLMLIIAAFFGAGTGMIQTKFLWSNKSLAPKFKQLNPIQGLKRIFGAKNAFQTFKSIAKLAIILPIAYYAFLEIFPQLMGLMHIPLQQQLPFAGDAATTIYIRIAVLLLILAIIDWIWTTYKHKEDLKMSKQEVKDEQKATEGDEKTKKQIQQKGLQNAYRRMMEDIPSADVVVTNPTHIAVALSYSFEKGSAPKVVAKGKGYVAERIKRMAKENRIPVVERKPLARALFKAVEVGQEIPYELYAAVAELLSYVYRIKGKNPLGGAANGQQQGA